MTTEKMMRITVAVVVACAALHMPTTNAVAATASKDFRGIDFEGFSAGEFVRNVGHGTTVSISPLPGSSVEDGGCFDVKDKDGNPLPMIFDSSNPTGNDDDLGSPNRDFGGPGRGNGGNRDALGENSAAFGNLLIISEDCSSEEPDDSQFGGIITFKFKDYKSIKSIGLLDFEDGGFISAKMEDGTVYESGLIEGVGNNGFADVPLHLLSVVELSVTVPKSGGIAYVAFARIDPIGAYGDPHFKTWNGTIYSYHGECDLVLLQNPTFDDGIGMDIHLRTRIQGPLSVIQNAVVAIGQDRLEVVTEQARGGTVSFSNGVANTGIPSSIGRFPILYRNKVLGNGLLQVFTIDLGDGDSITIKSFPTLVDVRVKSLRNRVSRFGGSLGMAGTLDGDWMGRDRDEVYEDPVLFASEWQVQSSEPKLFHDLEGPQHPDACVLPASSQPSRRRLRATKEEGEIGYKAAKRACSRVVSPEGNDEGASYDSCVSDVLGMGRLDIADHYQ